MPVRIAMSTDFLDQVVVDFFSFRIAATIAQIIRNEIVTGVVAFILYGLPCGVDRILYDKHPAATMAAGCFLLQEIALLCDS